jgi:hypothetical protein
MDFIEITGSPCSGKSSFIAQKVLRGEANQANCKNYFIKICNFYLGVRYLGLKRILVLLSWSLKENASLIFRINIFRNAVQKFGLFQSLTTSISRGSNKYLVDEGLSHLSFLFLNTDTYRVVEFISEELKRIRVHYLKSPGNEVVKARLIKRGHKRLKFLSVNYFTEKNQSIEEILLILYPKLCKELDII